MTTVASEAAISLGVIFAPVFSDESPDEAAHQRHLEGSGSRQTREMMPSSCAGKAGA